MRKTANAVRRSEKLARAQSLQMTVMMMMMKRIYGCRREENAFPGDSTAKDCEGCRRSEFRNN